MELDIRKINDLYFERYIGTKKMIDHFHQMIASGELEDSVDKSDKIGLKILNDFVTHSSESGMPADDGNHS